MLKGVKTNNVDELVIKDINNLKIDTMTPINKLVYHLVDINDVESLLKVKHKIGKIEMISKNTKHLDYVYNWMSDYTNKIMVHKLKYQCVDDMNDSKIFIKRMNYLGTIYTINEEYDLNDFTKKIDLNKNKDNVMILGGYLTTDNKEIYYKELIF